MKKKLKEYENSVMGKNMPYKRSVNLSNSKLRRKMFLKKESAM